MKRFVLTAALVSLVFCTSGCVKTSYNIEIDKKNNITISETDAYNQKLFKDFAKYGQSVENLADIDDNIENDKESLLAEGYDVTDYVEDDFKGLVIKKEYPKNSLEESNLPEGFTSAKSKPLTIEKGFLKTRYHLGMTYDVSKAAENSNNRASLTGLSEIYNMENDRNVSNVDNNTDMTINENDSAEGGDDETTASESSTSSDTSGSRANNMINAVVESMPEFAPSMDLTVKVPYKATKCNATKVISDTEYFWQLSPEGQNDISVDYEKYNYGNIIMAGILLIAFIFFGIYYKKFLNTSNW